MGGCLGSQYRDIYSKNEKINLWKKDFEQLNLTEQDVGRLYRVFRFVDSDGSGSVDIGELLVNLNIDTSPFTQRIFSIFDDDASGHIDFKEFVMSLWNYCTLGKSTLVIFAFDLYDNDSSGSIGPEEVIKMLKDIYSDSYSTNGNAKAVAKDLASLEAADGVIDVEDFKQFSKTHPALLFPAFDLQINMRSGVLGSEFWEFQSSKRMELSKGRYISVEELANIAFASIVSKDIKTAYLEGAQRNVNAKTAELIKKTGTHAARVRKDRKIHPEVEDEPADVHVKNSRPGIISRIRHSFTKKGTQENLKRIRQSITSRPVKVVSKGTLTSTSTEAVSPEQQNKVKVSHSGGGVDSAGSRFFYSEKGLMLMELCRKPIGVYRCVLIVVVLLPFYFCCFWIKHAREKQSTNSGWNLGRT